MSKITVDSIDWAPPPSFRNLWIRQCNKKKTGDFNIRCDIMAESAGSPRQKGPDRSLADRQFYRMGTRILVNRIT